MTDQKLKKQFARLGYELSYHKDMMTSAAIVNTTGEIAGWLRVRRDGWGLRKFGTTDEEMYLETKEEVEYKLNELSYLLKEDCHEN